jgi:hypothetical protein
MIVYVVERKALRLLEIRRRLPDDDIHLGFLADLGFRP